MDIPFNWARLLSDDKIGHIMLVHTYLKSAQCIRLLFVWPNCSRGAAGFHLAARWLEQTLQQFGHDLHIEAVAKETVLLLGGDLTGEAFSKGRGGVSGTAPMEINYQLIRQINQLTPSWAGNKEAFHLFSEPPVDWFFNEFFNGP